MAEQAADISAVGAGPVEVVDAEPRRVRRPLDLVRVVGLALILALIAVFGTVAHDTVAGANSDVTRLLGEIPHLLVRTLSVVGTVGALALPLGLVIRELLRSHLRRLIEGLITGLIAIGVIGLLDLAVSAASHTSLHHALTTVGTSSAGRPLDAYLAALFALAVVVGIGSEPTWRALFWVTTGIYMVSVFTAAQASLLSLVASPTIGVFVAVLVRYAFGSTNVRPDAARIAAALNGQKLRIVRMERTTTSGENYRTYRATDVTGRNRHVVALDRDLVASGAIYGLYRRLRLRADIALPASLSLEDVAERRALLALAAQQVGVPVPRLLAGVPCGPECISLAYEVVDGPDLDEATDGQLAQLWRDVAALHQRRITHRGLTYGRLKTDAHGGVVLPILTDGDVFAAETRILLDRAQLLVTTTLLADAERAVSVARSSLSEQELAACLPLLQPIALSRATRAALKKHPGALEALREQVERQTAHELPPPARVERFRPRTVVTIAAALVAGYLLIGQLGSVNLATVFSAAHWGWVPLVLLASAGTYVGAAISLSGFVREKLSFVRTVLAQLAASFAGFITPPSVGGVAINVRYLRAAGLPTSGAATSVAVSQVVNGVVHAVLLVVVTAATGSASHPNLPIPSWVFIAVGGLAVVVGILLAVPVTRRWVLARVLPPLREALPRLLDLLSSPGKLTEALGGTLVLNACYVAALWFSVRAFAGTVPVAAVAVVYLAGAAVASVAPTPGGLGAVEVALSTGLTAAGMPGASAVSAVLLFRIATYWLPVPVGWLAMHVLERWHAL
jgi:glycosyltransferase 2 family protein